MPDDVNENFKKLCDLLTIMIKEYLELARQKGPEEEKKATELATQMTTRFIVYASYMSR